MSSDGSKILTRLEQFFMVLFRAVLGMGVLFIAILVFLILRRSLQDNQFVLQPFEVPEHLEKNGLSGHVLARKIQDEVTALKQEVSSSKADSVQFSSESRPEMDMAVMGLGLSLNTITYYCRELFGRPNRRISGEVVDFGSKLGLTIRMTGYEPAEISIPVQDGDRYAALESLTHEGGKTILRITDPYRLAIWEYHQENFEQATALVRSILNDDENPDHKWAYLAWGHILREQDDLDGAASKYKVCLTMDEDFQHALQSLGWLHFRQQEYNQAAGVFEKLVATDPTEGFYWNSLGQARRQAQDYEGASQAFEKLIEYKPELYWPPINYASMLMHQMRDTVQAVKWYEHAQSLASPGIEYYYTAAILYQYHGRADSAVWAMERVLDLRPDDITALRSIANYRFNILKDFEQVVEVGRRTRRAVGDRRLPFGDDLYNTQQIYNYTAMAFYEQEQFDSSIHFAEAAIALEPTVAYPYSTLAEAYLLRGDKRQFYRHLEKALELGFDVRRYLTEHPYNQVAEEAQLEKLIQRYLPELLD